MLEIVVSAINLEVMPAQAATWLPGYTYRKKHILIGAGNAGVDYQMMFKVRRATGTDSGNIVYVSDKCKADFSDIRFADANGNVFPYYITYRTTDEAWVWVKPSFDLSVNQTIYMYYGNSDATDESNLDSTFVFAETWTSNSTINEGGRWTIEAAGNGITVNTDNQRLELNALSGKTPARVRSTRTNIAFPSSFRVESLIATQYSTDLTQIAFHFAVYITSDSTGKGTRGDWSIHVAGFVDPGTAFVSMVGYQSGGVAKSDARAGVGHNEDWTLGISGGYNDRKFIIVRNASDYFKIYHEGTVVLTEYNTEAPNRIYFSLSNTLTGNYYAYVFPFKVRKYVDPEPSNGEWYPEETFSGLTCSVTVNAEPAWLPNGLFRLDLDVYQMPYANTVSAGTHNLTILDETITLNATHIYNFKHWKKDGYVYSYESTCQFTINYGESFEFTATYDAYAVNVTTTPEGLNVDFEADGWQLTTPSLIYRGPGYHTFRASTTTIYYNATHLLKFMGWFVNDLFISPNENINLYISRNSTVKLAYGFTETPQAPPMTFRAQLVTLGDVAPGSTKDFVITVLFDQNAITITKIEFQLKQEWFMLQEPLPKQASRGMEAIGTATIQAQLKTPENVQGYYSIPFIVTATTPQDLTITTASYITFTITATPRISETTTITAGGFMETITRILGNPILLLLLIALIIWLSAYSLKNH
jgi:hypothetical protein